MRKTVRKDLIKHFHFLKNRLGRKSEKGTLHFESKEKIFEFIKRQGYIKQ